MRQVRSLVGAVLMLMAAACSNLKGTAITDANKDEVAAKVSRSNLSPEEKELFALFMGRLASLREIGPLGARLAALALKDKTVQRVIDGERRYQGTLKAEKEGMAKAEERRKPRVAEYLPQVTLSGITAFRGNNSLLGCDCASVNGEVRNAGSQSLDQVEFTVYLLDKNGSPVHEDKHLLIPMGDPPLKASHSLKLSAVVAKAPTAWGGAVEVKVTNLRFSDEKKP